MDLGTKPNQSYQPKDHIGSPANYIGLMTNFHKLCSSKDHAGTTVNYIGLRTKSHK